VRGHSESLSRFTLTLTLPGGEGISPVTFHAHSRHIVRVLVTAGPTREFIDDVRFISSPSSGRMGYAVAQVFAAAGHTVELVAGPTNLQPPAGVTCTRVESAVEMHDAVMARLSAVDAVVMTAAVGRLSRFGAL